MSGHKSVQMREIKMIKTLKYKKKLRLFLGQVYILNALTEYRISKRNQAMVLAIVLINGCTVGPDFQRPSPPTVNHYLRAMPVAHERVQIKNVAIQHFDENATISNEWWTIFSSPTLNALVQQALIHNPSLVSAEAALRQAQEYVVEQGGYYYPTVQAGYSPGRQKNAVGTISPTLTSGEPLYTLHTAQLSISYAPDVFGLNRRTIESLQAQEESQRFQLEATRLTLISNVVATAIQQAAISAQIAATKNIIETEAKLMTLLQRQAELGFASGLDVAAQETALAQSEQTLPPLNKQLAQTRNLLAILAGKLPAEGGFDDFDLDKLQLPMSLPLTLPSKLVEQRPDVRAAEAQMHAASAQVGVAIANRLPQLSISAMYGGSANKFSEMFLNNNIFWGVTGNLVQTIFDGGTLLHRQRATQAAFEQTTAQYRSIVLAAFQNVADTLYAIDADNQALSAALKADSASQKALLLTNAQLKLGATNALVLLNAEQANQQTRISKIQSQAARFADTIALYQALGGGADIDKVDVTVRAKNAADF